MLLSCELTIYATKDARPRQDERCYLWRRTQNVYTNRPVTDGIVVEYVVLCQLQPGAFEDERMSKL